MGLGQAAQRNNGLEASPASLAAQSHSDRANRPERCCRRVSLAATGIIRTSSGAARFPVVTFGVPSGAVLVDGGVADPAIVVADNLVVGVRPGGRYDVQALTRCFKERDQLGVGDVPAWVSGDRGGVGVGDGQGERQAAAWARCGPVPFRLWRYVPSQLRVKPPRCSGRMVTGTPTPAACLSISRITSVGCP